MPATNPGTTNLVSWWSLDEASGTRADSHGSNDLTDNNTVGSAPGKQSNAADFEFDNSEYLSITDAAQTGLDPGDTDWSLCLWYKGESVSGNTIFPGLFNKADTGGNSSWRLYHNFNLTLSSLRWQVFNGAGTSIGSVDATGLAGSGGTWYFVAVFHSATDNQIGISINGATWTTAATTGAAGSSSIALHVGARIFGGSPGGYFDGLIDEAAFWSDKLTNDELAFLYNSGAGVTYSDVAGGGLAQPLSGPFGRLLTGLVR